MAAEPLPVYCARQDVLDENQITGDEDAMVDRLIDRACRQFERAMGWSFYQQIKTDQVRRGADVICGRDGLLLVRLPTPHLTEVTALAYRAGMPTAGWTSVQLNNLDWDPDSLSATLQAYLPAGLGTDRLWAQVSYTAGWAGDDDDPFPSDLQELIVWWAGWLWRSKDAPFEKTANNLTGTVTIPTAMPSRLKAMLPAWKAPWVV